MQDKITADVAIIGGHDPAFLDLLFYSRNTLGRKTAIASD